MAVCLPKINKEKFLNALKGGVLTIEKLYNLSEGERRALLSKFVGKENANFVNAKFEQAMLSRQKQAFSNWIKNTIKDPELRKDALDKVERNKKFLSPNEQKGFLEDLAETKLGLRVSEAEAKFLLEQKERIDNLETKIDRNSKDGDQSRMEYGLAVNAFKRFISEKTQKAKEIPVKELFLPKNWGELASKVAGIAKSLVASLDDSVIGRQGIKILYKNPKLWAESAIKSFELFIKELFGKSPEGFFKDRPDTMMDTMRAWIYSSENALNGKYNAAKNGYGLGVLAEEAFPSSVPERIPVLGKFFKASETAFNGTSLFMRKKLADGVIKNAERNGVDMLDPREATAHGKRVASLTGRGEIGRLGAIGKEINVLMFSVRFLKSNLDTLTAHMFDKEFTPSARKAAAIDTLRIAGSIYGLLTIAKLLDEDSTDLDPRSSKFGTLYGIDITGGLRGLVTLGSRIVPTFHDGELGFWSKSATTGKWTKMTGDQFGERTALDMIESFFEGKLSPAAGMIRDIWKGRNFLGEKPTIINSTLGLITPISVQTLIEELKKGSDDLLLTMIAEGLGFSPITFDFRGQGTKWEELKEKKGERVFNESLKIIQQKFNERAQKLEQSSRWERMDFEEKNKELDKIRREETDKIFNKYGIQKER